MFNSKIIFVLLFIFFSFFTFQDLQAKEKRKNFVVFTPPKCGTHLIGKALGLMLNEEPMYCLAELGTVDQALATIASATEQGRFVVAHNFSPELIEALIDRGYRTIFILRDPRDQVISMMNFMKKGNWPEYPVAHLTDCDEMIDELITGARFGMRCYEKCIKHRLSRILPLSTKIVYVARFENLVGPEGRGTKEAQLTELLNMAQFIKFDLSLNEAKEVGKKLFGGTGTFHEGQIGKWKEYFKPYHKELYKMIYGRILIQLGYEKNFDW